MRNEWNNFRSEAGAKASANFRMADMYADGIGVPQGSREAEKCCQRGADIESTGARAGYPAVTDL
jgi:hypothetical protein